MHEVALGFGRLARERSRELDGSTLNDPVSGRRLFDGELLVVHRVHITPIAVDAVAGL
jgi:hypothetical protein